MNIFAILTNLICRFRGEVSTYTLIKRGMNVGKNFHRMNGVWIDPGHAWLISIGDDVTIAPRVTILAHDASPQAFRQITKIGRVNIGDSVFIGAGSIILPGVTIGNNVVIGAGSVVTKDIHDNCVAAGNPAKNIMTISDYLDKIDNMEIFFDSPHDYFPNISDERRKMQRHVLSDNRFALLGKKSNNID